MPQAHIIPSDTPDISGESLGDLVDKIAASEDRNVDLPKDWDKKRPDETRRKLRPHGPAPVAG